MSTLPGSAYAAPRLPYVPPRVTPLGQWSAVTLLISLPVGPGTKVFNPGPVYSGGK